MIKTDIRHENGNFKVMFRFLEEVDHCFIPVLSQRVDLVQYARKISQYADMFNLWNGNELIGNVAVYLNDKENGFVTSFAIKPQYQNLGYGKKLWTHVVQEAEKRGINIIFLKVHQNNYAARAFYIKQGFIVEHVIDEWVKMKYQVKSENEE